MTNPDADGVAAAFVAALGDRAAVAPERLETLLAKVVGDARAVWPEPWVSPAEFGTYLAGRVEPGSSVEAFLGGLHAADLYLACACVHGVDGAVRAFERTCLARIDTFVHRVDASPAFLDEGRQALRERLLLPRDDGSPRLSAYSGRGSLVNWVGIAAQRMALSARQNARKHDTLDSQVESELAAQSDPELQYLKARYEQDFHVALREAMETLEPRERALLRLHYANGLSLDKIAAVYRVNSSTVSRWLAAAREGILHRMKKNLEARLNLSPAEFESLARLVRSNLETSLLQLLGEQASPA